MRCYLVHVHSDKTAVFSVDQTQCLVFLFVVVFLGGGGLIGHVMWERAKKHQVFKRKSAHLIVVAIVRLVRLCSDVGGPKCSFQNLFTA